MVQIKGIRRSEGKEGKPVGRTLEGEDLVALACLNTVPTLPLPAAGASPLASGGLGPTFMERVSGEQLPLCLLMQVPVDVGAGIRIGCHVTHGWLSLRLVQATEE